MTSSLLPAVSPLSWGLRDLDAAIGTGFPGRLVVVGARPSNGKTTWLFNWVNTLYGNPESRLRRVLCFWTERDVELAYWTWACLRFGVELDQAIKGLWSQLPAGAKDSIRREIVELHGWDDRFWFARNERPTVSRIAAEVDRFQPEVLVLDYIQRVKAEGRQTKFDAIAEAANALQHMAVERKMLVVVGSQLKRRGDGVFDKYRPPHLEDFKLAGEIEENADVALGLYRPLRHMTAKQERQVKAGELDLEPFKLPGTMAIKVLKHRYWGDAADRIVRVRCQRGQVLDYEETTAKVPVGAGDAWEPEDARVPF